MSGSWNSINGVSYLEFSGGSAGAIGTGAFTLAALWQNASNNHAIAGLNDGSNVEQRAFLVDSLHLYSRNDFTAGFGTISTATWYVGGVNKPAGAGQLYRYHLWPYAAAGTGSFSHGTTGATQGDGNSINTIRVGNFGGSGIGNGLIAVLAGWARELSDGEWDTLKSNQLSAWKALNPSFLIDMSGWNGTTGAVDKGGTSTFNTLGGTVGVGAEPPSFNYSLGSNNSGQMMFFL